MGEESERRGVRAAVWRSISQWLRVLAPVCVLLLACCLAAPAQRLTMATFGSGAGLSNMVVTTLLQDHTGVVWVGTESGVFVADAQRFVRQTAFTEASMEMIVSLREDARGRIWALDNRRLVYWDGASIHEIQGLNLRRMVNTAHDLIVLPEEPDAVFLLHGQELLRVGSPDAGRSWNTQPAVSFEKIDRFPQLRAITSVAGGGGSILWAGCGVMLCRLDVALGKLDLFGEREGVPADQWDCLMIARDGAVWARSARSILRMKPEASRFEIVGGYPANTRLNVEVPLMAEDPAGRVLLTVAEGLLRYSQEGWRVFDHSNGLPDAEAQALLFDRGGEMWVAPDGLGIARTEGYDLWEGWTKAGGLRSNLVWNSAVARDGSVWALTGAGLDHKDRGEDRFVAAQSSLTSHRLRAGALDARQHLWLGDSEGRLIDYDTRNGAARLAASDLGKVLQLLIDSRERIWVCSQAGLRFLSPDDGWRTLRLPSQPELAKAYVWSIVEGQHGVLWLTNGSGLYRLDGDVWRPVALPFPGGKDYNFLVAPAADGTLWVQSKQPSPVLRLRVEGDPFTGFRAVIVDKVAMADAGSDNITFLKTDRRGWLWVGSDEGVHVFNGVAWVQVTGEEGLIWDDTDFQAFDEDRDGTVWIGTSGGLSHLLHPERLFSLPPPDIRLTEERLADQTMHGNDPSFDLRRPALSVHILNTSYDRRNAITYRYRLEGQEGEWQEQRVGALRFPALNAGNYKLSVLAYDTRTHQSSRPATLAFTVLEPWWRRPWFFCMEGVAVLLTGFFCWRFSVHLLLKQRLALERLVALRTRELEREKTELLNTRSALLEMTRRDTLTGLLNRAAIFAQLSTLCEESLRDGRPLAVAMADLDSFKTINDCHGHMMGDAVLRECARRIEGVTRGDDAVGRYGGEELLILLPGLNPSNAPLRMKELRSAIDSTLIVHAGTSLTVTCSFGVAWLGGERCTLESLVERADAALYRAKQNGRNRVEFADETIRAVAVALPESVSLQAAVV